MGILDPSTEDLGEPGKEMDARGRKLRNEPSVLIELLLYPVVVEDGECDRCFPDPPCTGESEGFEVFSESNNLRNQVVTSKTIPRRRRRQFTERHAMRT